jgi:hypothetical protein
MVLMGYSGARGTLIYEKNLKAEISCQTPSLTRPGDEGQYECHINSIPIKILTVKLTLTGERTYNAHLQFYTLEMLQKIECV